MRKHERKDRRALILSEQTFPIIEQITAGEAGGGFFFSSPEEKGVGFFHQKVFLIY